MGEQTQPDPNQLPDQPTDPSSPAPQQLSAADSDQQGPAPWYGYPPSENDVRTVRAVEGGYLPPAAASQSQAGPQQVGAGPYPGGTTWGSAPATAWTGAGGPSGPGAPATTAPKSKPWKKVAGGIALAAVIAGGGVAAVSAANASNGSASTQTAPGGFGANGNGMAANGYELAAGVSGTGMPGGRGGVTALINALHGEFVVQTQDGGIQTQRLQSGAVTALSADSLLVTSSDGFTATYVLPGDLVMSSIAVGDTVRVVATVDGDTVTATSVQSGTLGGQGQGGQGQGGGGMPGGAGVQDGTVPNGTVPGGTVPGGSVPTGAQVAPQTS